MGRFEYPTALEQYTQGLEYHAEQFYDQADFAYKQKALALPPTREQFLNTVFSPETSVAIGTDTAQASVEAILAFERTPLDEEPYPLPTTPVALVQQPVAGDGRSQTPDAAKDRSRTMLSLPSQSARSGTNWMKGKSFKRLSHTRSDALSPGSSPASTGSHVDPRSQHRGAFFRASVANLDA